MLSNDHIVHVSTDSDKTGFRTNNGDNEYVTWQPKQGDMEASNVVQKAFNSGVASRSNKNATDGRDNRIQNREYSCNHFSFTLLLWAAGGDAGCNWCVLWALFFFIISKTGQYADTSQLLQSDG